MTPLDVAAGAIAVEVGVEADVSAEFEADEALRDPKTPPRTAAMMITIIMMPARSISFVSRNQERRP